MRIGVLTGGGDCPGLNAVIRAVTLSLLPAHELLGIERGFWGLMVDRLRPLDAAAVRDRLDEGGTLLGTHNRCDPFHYFGRGTDCSERRPGLCRRHWGWTRWWPSAATAPWPLPTASALGLPMVGVPKTIDNDLATPNAPSASTARWRWWPRR
jgi:6-phosphofructokinase